MEKILTLILLILTIIILGCSEGNQMKDVTSKEAPMLIENNPEIIILDVRTAEEFAEGHLANAINIDYYQENFKEQLNQLDKNKIYLVYCRSGKRSATTIEIMKELNFMEVNNLAGGFNDWQENGYSSVTE